MWLEKSTEAQSSPEHIKVKNYYLSTLLSPSITQPCHIMAKQNDYH